MTVNYASEAAVAAYRRLVEVNLGTASRETQDWLHSEDAQPALRELLAVFPCPETLH